MPASKKPSLSRPFSFAFSGIWEVIKAERNIKVHLVLAALAILLGLILGISRLEWLAIVLIISAVLVAEIFNSAIEEICNLLRRENHLDYQETKFIRDTSAGAVLILAIASIIIGAIIFLPYLL
ncbi:diacylglycerol kinase family protein [Patescibacteria group bacterium]|nr:diacylglycerol kinase family protein [Patescibacteria group bacterium]